MSDIYTESGGEGEQSKRVRTLTFKSLEKYVETKGYYDELLKQSCK